MKYGLYHVIRNMTFAEMLEVFIDACQITAGLVLALYSLFDNSLVVSIGLMIGSYYTLSSGLKYAARTILRVSIRLIAERNAGN